METIAYLAPEGYLEPLLEELGTLVTAFHGRLVRTKKPSRDPVWAQNIWYDPIELPFESIGDAAKKLKTIQRNWSCYSFDHHRRAALITEKLPHVSAKPIAFLAPLPTAPLGGWALLEKNLMLASPATSSPFPQGEVQFLENKEGPPNRAYLKLWEAFTLLGRHPGPGDVCLDLGSSPGGWTWVLAGLGAKVISVDKAPLAPAIGKLPHVEFVKESAFGLEPKRVGKVDWLFSDIACYPERLLRLVERWMKEGGVPHFVCTLKFQGKTDMETARKFAAIPGSRLIHLSHNKHELTWVRL
jgi:23S rRNA (cytidine2498-2'-O)-methyltransferase